MKIAETKDYTRFELYSINRDVSREKFLKKSLEKYGWISAFPMYVVRNGATKLKIKDGHHRFHVAKQLNIPVKYVLCEENGMSIHELNKTMRSWSINDYLDSYVKQGRTSYRYLKQYCTRTGISVSVAIPLLYGNYGGSSGNALLNQFKDGLFETSQEGINTALIVEQIVSVMNNEARDFASHKNFVGAIAKVCAVSEVNREQLIKKLKKHSSLLRKQPTVDLYLKNIEEVYNRQSRSDIIPLCHLVKAEMKRRYELTIKPSK